MRIEEEIRTAIEALEWNGVKPTKTFTAFAGRDYAAVEAWEIGPGPFSRYAIRFPNLEVKGETLYETTSNADKLDEWLFEYSSYDCPYGIALLINRANVYGLDGIESTPVDSKATCVVLKEHDTRVDAVEGENRGRIYSSPTEPRIFDSAAEAQAWIDSAAAANEKYKVVTVQYRDIIHSDDENAVAIQQEA